MNNSTPVLLIYGFCITFLVLSVFSIKSAQAENKRVEFWVLGIGSESCAHWLSQPSYERDGNSWLLGYWTGLNNANTQNKLVGSTTDGEGIIAEVKKNCITEPSKGLVAATSNVYLKFQQEGK